MINNQSSDPAKVFELIKSEIVIGRDEGVDVVIPTPAVSRRHAKLSMEGNGYVIEDLGSSNGTFVNGERLRARKALNAGDEIKLGQAITLSYTAPATQESQKTAVRPAPAKPSQPAHLMQTMIGEEPVVRSGTALGPPRLVVTIAGEKQQTYTLTSQSLSIGRVEGNDIVIPSQIVSSRHARLDKVDGGYQVSVIPEAKNPMLFEGRPLEGPRVLRHGDLLRLGSLDPGTMVTISYEVPGEVTQETEQDVVFGEKALIQIGRDPSNDVVIASPNVSRFHAQVERVGQRYRVEDLRSSNGTFVNGERIEGSVWLKPDDTIRIGQHRLVMGKNQIVKYDDSNGLRVDAINLNKWVRKDLNILQNISVSFKPKEFIVVVGQSGGGKSTFVDAVAGYRPATPPSRVLVNDIDIYSHFDAVRNDIGFVPQKDIIHMELTVYQALDYAAQLRMPADTTAAERHNRVMEVLADLDLTHRKDVQISGLSGGQQKRVSIGVELITKPGLFFLDEPTSGLDPGTETALMQLMRRLADQGRTIILITHATKNVMLADKVIFLARGGYLAWFGPPD
ncbi:MAG TPA: ABC transporter ATP-binding protein, partial [Anaerolineae bacterium]|nr:ABC transporter ATP-binding protein [Anaerolineae bacterium]